MRAKLTLTCCPAPSWRMTGRSPTRGYIQLMRRRAPFPLFCPSTTTIQCKLLFSMALAFRNDEHRSAAIQSPAWQPIPLLQGERAFCDLQSHADGSGDADVYPQGRPPLLRCSDQRLHYRGSASLHNQMCATVVLHFDSAYLRHGCSQSLVASTTLSRDHVSTTSIGPISGARLSSGRPAPTNQYLQHGRCTSARTNDGRWTFLP